MVAAGILYRSSNSLRWHAASDLAALSVEDGRVLDSSGGTPRTRALAGRLQPLRLLADADGLHLVSETTHDMAPAWSSWWSSPRSHESSRARRRRRAASPQKMQQGPSPPATRPRSLERKWEQPLSDFLPSSDMGSHLVRRQQNPVVIIPTFYSDMDDSPAPGTVVGAVLGSVVGFLLILWLINSCLNRGGGAAVEEDDYVGQERRASRSSRHSHSHSHSHSRSSPPVPRSPPRTETHIEERVIIEDTRRTTRSPDDDFVEVIEEEVPRRSRGSRSRPLSGYRSVDPERFAGGDDPVQEVYDRRSSRRR